MQNGLSLCSSIFIPFSDLREKITTVFIITDRYYCDADGRPQGGSLSDRGCSATPLHAVMQSAHYRLLVACTAASEREIGHLRLSYGELKIKNCGRRPPSWIWPKWIFTIPRPRRRILHHQHVKCQHNRPIHSWVIDDSTTFSAGSFVPQVLRFWERSTSNFGRR